ncbi:methionyl-tRNA formyltransferase [Saccharopolyspora spinosa]
MILDMPKSPRVVLASFGPDQFATLHSTCEQAGFVPVSYAYSRSKRPRQRSSPNSGRIVGEVLNAIPPGMDLLLPGSADGLATALSGYCPDLVVVYGFSWKLPETVLRLPRYGVINVHTSLLPRYRGPAPVLWAIRNGDADMGVTIHRMDGEFDTGNIIVQRGGIPLDDDITQESLSARINPVIGDLLSIALERVATGFPGTPQDDSEASYAGFMEPGFSHVDWSHTARDIHNQVRTFRHMGSGRGPLGQIDGRWVKILRTSTTRAEGIRVDCADGPLWVTEFVPAEPPATDGPTPR